MAVTYQQYSIYSSTQLREHYAVIFWNGDDIRLTWDLSSVYPEAPLAQVQGEESLGVMLDRIRQYQVASFFERWRLRLFTSIEADQIKLGLAGRIVEERLRGGDEIPAQGPESLLARLRDYTAQLPNAPSNRSPVLGRVYSLITCEKQTLWGGLVTWLKLKFSSKRVYTDQVEVKALEAKRDLHLVYADATQSLFERHVQECIGKPGRAASLIQRAEKEAKTLAEKLRSGFSKDYAWEPASEAITAEDVQQGIEGLNAEFDEIEKAGKEKLNQMKEHLMVFEKIQTNLAKTERAAEKEWKRLVKDKTFLSVKLERLAQLQSKVKTDYARELFLTPAAQSLQFTGSLFPEAQQRLVDEFAQRLDQRVATVVETLRKRAQSPEDQHEIHKTLYEGYQGLLAKTLSLLNLTDATVLEQEKAIGETQVGEFKVLCDRYNSAFHQDYLNACKPVWEARLEQSLQAVESWEAIVLEQERFKEALAEIKVVERISGVLASTGRYEHLIKAHAQALHQQLLGYEGEHELLPLVEKSEDLLELLDEAVWADRDPLNAPRASVGSENALGYYQQHCVQVMHALSQTITQNEELLAESIAFFGEGLTQLKAQLLKELRLLTPSSENVADRERAFEVGCKPWDDFMCTVFFEVTASEGGALKQCVEDPIEACQAMSFWPEALEKFEERYEKDITKLIQLECVKGGSAELLRERILKRITALQIAYLSSEMLVIEKNAEAAERFLYVKALLHRHCETVLVPQIEAIVLHIRDWENSLRSEAVRNLRCGLKEEALFHGPNDVVGTALKYKGLRVDIPGVYEDIREEGSRELQEKAQRLQDQSIPALSLSIERSVEWMWRRFNESVLVPQEKALQAAQEGGHTSVVNRGHRPPAFEEWVKQVRHVDHTFITALLDGYQRGMATEALGALRARILKDFGEQRETLTQAFYRSIEGESPERQLVMLKYAQQYWNSQLTFGQYDFLTIVRIWDELLATKSEAVEVDGDLDAEVGKGLYERLMQERGEFWVGDIYQDAATVQRILRWQEAQIQRKRESGQSMVSEEIANLQKEGLKVIKYFKLVYHPDKLKADTKAKEEIKERVFQLEERANELGTREERVEFQSPVQEGYSLAERELLACLEAYWDSRKLQAFYREKMAQLDILQAEIVVQYAKMDVEIAAQEKETAELKVKTEAQEKETAQLKAKMVVLEARMMEFLKTGLPHDTGVQAPSLPRTLSTEKKPAIAQGDGRPEVQEMSTPGIHSPLFFATVADPLSEGAKGEAYTNGYDQEETHSVSPLDL